MQCLVFQFTRALPEECLQEELKSIPLMKETLTRAGRLKNTAGSKRMLLIHSIQRSLVTAPGHTRGNWMSETGEPAYVCWAYDGPQNGTKPILFPQHEAASTHVLNEPLCFAYSAAAHCLARCARPYFPNALFFSPVVWLKITCSLCGSPWPYMALPWVKLFSIGNKKPLNLWSHSTAHITPKTDFPRIVSLMVTSMTSLSWNPSTENTLLSKCS